MKETRDHPRSKQKNFNVDDIFRDIHFLFESDKEDYFEPIRTDNAFNNNYIKYDSEGDRSKVVSIEEDLNNIRPYLSNTINDLQTQGETKIQLSIEINFYFFQRYSRNACYAFKR